MHKCQNCGTEFVGKFCPECGTPAPQIVCPHCGAELRTPTKFCPECGNALPEGVTSAAGSLSPTAPPQPPTAASKASPFAVKLCTLLPTAVAVLFALFSVLLFLFFLAPVATSLLGAVGNLYEYAGMRSATPSDLTSGGMEGIFGGDETLDAVLGVKATTNACIALIVFAAIGLAAAGVALASCFVPSLRERRVFGVRLSLLIDYALLLFYFVDFLLGCIVAGTCGDEITKPGAAPVLVLVFSLLFGLISAAATVAIALRAKFFPAAHAAIEAERKRRIAALPKPQPPTDAPAEKPTKPTFRTVGEPSKQTVAEAVRCMRAKKLFLLFSLIAFLILSCYEIYMVAIAWGLPPTMMNYAPSTSPTKQDFVRRYVSLWAANAHEKGWQPVQWLMLFCVMLAPVLTVLTAVLGGIFGSKYYKKFIPIGVRLPRTDKFERMLLPAIVCGFAAILFLDGFLFTASFLGRMRSGGIYGYSQYKQGDGAYAYGKCALVTLIMCALFLIAELPFLIRLARRERTANIALYGTDKPETAPEYLAAKREHEEKEAAWHDFKRRERKYRRDLARYKSGLPPKTE